MKIKVNFSDTTRLQEPWREANETLDDASTRNTRALRLVTQDLPKIMVRFYRNYVDSLMP
jgi:hypothetical protein